MIIWQNLNNVGRRPLDNGNKIQTLCAGSCVLHKLFSFVGFQKLFDPPMTLLLILLLTYVCNQPELFGLLCLDQHPMFIPVQLCETPALVFCERFK